MYIHCTHASPTSPSQRRLAEASKEQTEASAHPARGESSTMQGIAPNDDLDFHVQLCERLFFADFAFNIYKEAQGATAAKAC